MSPKTIAWHGDPDLKAEVMARLRQHRAEDGIIQGAYQYEDSDLASKYRGCAIGCTLPYLDEEPNGWHAELERYYGIPKLVGFLIDDIFEDLPSGPHAEFAVAVIDAIPPGADLSRVADRLRLDMLVDEAHGALRWVDAGSEPHGAVEAAAALLRRDLSGDDPGRDAWCQARAHARSAGDGLTGHAVTACEIAADVGRNLAPPVDDHDTAWLAERLTHHLSAAPVLEVTHAA